MILEVTNNQISMATNNKCNLCIIILTIITIVLLPSSKSIIHLDFPAVFNFGDSNSDTGTLVTAGFESLYPPNGQTYFHVPSGRYSDGRLIIDFLSNN
jgi:hypothetical protein